MELKELSNFKIDKSHSSEFLLRLLISSSKIEEFEKISESIIAELLTRFANLQAEINNKDNALLNYPPLVEHLTKQNEDLKCCGNCNYCQGHDDCPYCTDWRITASHYCPQWQQSDNMTRGGGREK
jgi:uncharacterized paraquat-inducible protein A